MATKVPVARDERPSDRCKATFQKDDLPGRVGPISCFKRQEAHGRIWRGVMTGLPLCTGSRHSARDDTKAVGLERFFQSFRKPHP